MTVENSQLRFDFKKDNADRDYKPILLEDTVRVHMVIPNGSPFFEEKNSKGAHIRPPLPIDAEGHTFDMDQVDTSVSIRISQKLLKLHLK